MYRVGVRAIAFTAVITVASASPCLPADIEELLVTGSRIPRADRVGSSGLTRSQGDLTDWGVGQTVDALRGIPSLQISAPGGAGRAFLSLRGGEPNFTPIFVDGIRVNDPNDTFGGAFELGLIPAFDIESISVIPGALSPVVGSDALAGVVSIVTRTPKPGASQTVAANADSQGGGGVGASVNVQANDALAAVVSAGANTAATTDMAQDFDGRSIAVRARRTTSGAGFVDFTARTAKIDAAAYPQASGGALYSVTGGIERRERVLYLTGLRGFAPVGQRCDVDAEANWSKTDETTDNPGIAPGALDGTPPFTSKNKFDRLHALVNGVCRVRSWLAVSTGASWERENGVSDSQFNFGFPVPAVYMLKRSTPAAFAEIKVSAGPADLSGAVRRDFFRGRANMTTASARFSYAMPDAATIVFASYGEGFHLPSFFALGSPLVGNPNLLPESGASADAGVRSTLGNNLASAEVRWFRQDFRNLIDFDPDTFSNVNRARVVTKGVETLVTLFPDQPTQVAASFTRATYRAKTDVFLRPKWSGAVTLRWRPDERWTWSGRGTFTGRRRDSSIPTGPIDLPAYWRIDTSFAWRVTKETNVVASIDNLFDRQGQDAVGFQILGTIGRLSVQSSF